MTHVYRLTKFGRPVLQNKESRNKRHLSKMRWGHALFNGTGRLSVLLTWRALGGAKQSGDTPDFGIPAKDVILQANGALHVAGYNVSPRTGSC